MTSKMSVWHVTFLGLLGGVLRYRRISLGLTRSDLSRGAGVSLPSISRYEEGSTNPSLGNLRAMARGLDTKLSIVLEAVEWLVAELESPDFPIVVVDAPGPEDGEPLAACGAWPWIKRLLSSRGESAGGWS